MHVVLMIKESSHGLWCICSGEAVLYDKLHFAHAIRLARGLAREECASSGHAASVEMVCSEFTVVLAQYAEAGELRCEPALADSGHGSCGVVRQWQQNRTRCVQ